MNMNIYTNRLNEEDPVEKKHEKIKRKMYC